MKTKVFMYTKTLCHYCCYKYYATLVAINLEATGLPALTPKCREHKIYKVITTKEDPQILRVGEHKLK